MLSADSINEYCLRLRPTITHLPGWDAELAHKAAKSIVNISANRLEMGRFHSLLPSNVAGTAVIQQLNLPQFGQHYQSAALIEKSHLNEQLQMLIE
jgi:hypothetical protein